MNNTTHTPGPTCTCGVITTVIETGIGCYDENEIAQCPLCKSAPAMYEALKAIVGQQYPNRWGYDSAEIALDDEWRTQARAALAQAEGR